MRAGVADGDFAVFGRLVDDLHQLLAALLVHRRQRNADDAALNRRVEPEIGFANRLLDRP